MIKIVKKIISEIKFLFYGKKELLDLINESTKTIENLMELLPTNDLGIAINGFAKNILPNERIIMIKFNPITKSYQLNLFNKEETSIKTFKLDLYCATILAEKMKDENGILRSVFNKIMN